MPFLNKVKHLLLSTALVATLATPAMAQGDTHTQLTDISGSYAKTEIAALVEAGILNGYTDGSFLPKQNMTRQEFAKVLVKSMGLTENAAAAASFTDVDTWARPFVGALVEAGITQGTSATKFGAKDPVTREQLAVFFVRALEKEGVSEELGLHASFGDEPSVMTYAKPHVAMMQKIGFIKGSANAEGGFNFAPKGKAERQAVARLAYEFFQNGAAYAEKADVIAHIKSLLDRMNEATFATTSFEMDMIMDSPDMAELGFGEMKGTYTRDPHALFLQTTMAMNEEQQIPVDMYMLPDFLYMNVEGEWIKMTMPEEMQSMMAKGSNYEIPFTHVVAPFLTLTEQETTYTLTGTVPVTEYAGEPTVAQQLAVNASNATDIRFTIVIAKDSLLLQGNKIEALSGDEVVELMDVTYSNYNTVEPIVLPDAAKDAVDMSDME